MKDSELDKLVNVVIDMSTEISLLRKEINQELQLVNEKLQFVNTTLDKHEKQLFKLQKHMMSTNLSIIELRHSIEQIETKRFDDLNKRVSKLEKAML